MFIINCPYCGERDQTEFTCHGEAHIARPDNPSEISDEEWGKYLFFRENPKGTHFERWTHDHGCRRWFNVCLLYTSPSPRDQLTSRMPSSA